MFRFSIECVHSSEAGRARSVEPVRSHTLRRKLRSLCC